MDVTGIFRVLLRMEIRPGSEAEFESAWLEVGRRIAQEPANLGQTLVRCVEEPGVYVVLTDWVDEQAFRTFELGDAHVENRRLLQPYRVGGDMTLTRVVHDLGGAPRPLQGAAT
jgi:heme-degrading monooxygenase HmoA